LTPARTRVAAFALWARGTEGVAGARALTAEEPKTARL
jgi:hypothetical protein